MIHSNNVPVYLVVYFAVVMVTQSDAALKCFTCDKGLRLDSIVNSVTDDPLWERSPVVSDLLECSITSPPPAGKCVPCVNHEKVYIVSVDLPVDWKLDLEDSEGNYLSYTEAICPQLKIPHTTQEPLSQAPRNKHILWTVLVIVGAGIGAGIIVGIY